MKNTKLIVFDLDDTLFPEHEFVYSGFHAISEWMLDHYSVFSFFDVAWELFQAGKRGTIFNQTLDRLGVNYDCELIAQLIQVYRDHKPKIKLHEDAEWAIKFFKDYRCTGLITNGFLHTQQNKVRALGIESMLDQIIYCDVFGAENWKPSSVPYQKMMEFTGFEGSECLYIGDHPYKDFIGAKKLGWMTLRICRSDGEYAQMSADVGKDAHCKITSLYQLAHLC
ncbi:HAD family hydrolase [Pseudanabaenaceae cyanobacterium LEGE 13415]|nr:HAD family hydrolase [Pseudanabaenaceae cyanobacterium LEGE 13415]